MPLMAELATLNTAANGLYCRNLFEKKWIRHGRRNAKMTVWDVSDGTDYEGHQEHGLFLRKESAIARAEALVKLRLINAQEPITDEDGGITWHGDYSMWVQVWPREVIEY